MEKMKLGILIDRLNVGGVEKSAIREVRSLRAMGIDAVLLVLSRESVVENAHDDLVADLPVEYLDDRLPKFLRFTFKFPGFAFFSLFHITYPLLLSFVIKKGEYTHIVSHGSYTTLSALFIKWIKKIPYSIYFWDPTNYILKRVYIGKFPRHLLRVFAFFGRFVDRLLVQNAYKVFTASDTHDDYLRQYVSKEKLVVVYPGTFMGTPPIEKEAIVIMVTTWKEGKHPEYIFELFDKYRDFKILMVGGWLDAEMKKDFIDKIKELGLEDNIELFGKANEEQLRGLYPKAALQLTTNLEKGFGMPVLEAAACGTVSIVPLGSGVCRVFEHGKDAYYTEEHDTEAIVSYIKELTSDLIKAKTMGKLAFDRVKKGYTWDNHAEKILKTVSELQDL